MAIGACSVSRSVEEAALDDEWPGKPLKNLKQTTLPLFKRSPKPMPKKTKGVEKTKTTECRTVVTRSKKSKR